MKIENMRISVDRESVLRMIDCREDNPAYEDIEKAYEELLPEVMRLAQGRCLYGIGEIAAEDAAPDCPAGTKVLYVISTVGRELSGLESELFADGDYVKGLLADAMADACLFGLEVEWQEQVRQFLAELGLGVKARLEAPEGLPMSVQQTAYVCLNAGQELDMGITSGCMYDPVKSACYVLVLSDDPELFAAQHDCRRCPRLECRARKVSPVSVTVCSSEGKRQIPCEAGESILEAYRRQGGNAGAVCGGKGLCGKCRIRLITGALPVTDADRSVFGESELVAGFRLSCTAYPASDCEVELCFQDETEFQAVDQFAGGTASGPAASENQAAGGLADRTAGDPAAARDRAAGSLAGARDRAAAAKDQAAGAAGFGIAVDIGTTTLAAQIVDLGSGQVLASASSVNRQRSFGADVISRIEAASGGSGGKLQGLIRADISSLVGSLLDQVQAQARDVKRVVIAGNTTMGHLLMGYPCETLGVYPFTPVNIGVIRDSCRSVIGSGELDCEAVLFPGISTFVGGDIVSGLYACGVSQSDKVNLLVDLGTNGEMAIGCRDRLLVTSTAAGPAFEGGNISWGTGSIPGAICHVHMESEHEVKVETIGGRPPVGICGTGVIEITAELLKQELIDETGLLDEEYFEEGFPVAAAAGGEYIVFTQKDVREIQLAKSAVRAGVETLIRRYGISYEEIDQVYLAGGFGFKMDREAAVTVGLFPEELKDKITAVGNSSLAGAVRALRDPGWLTEVEGLVRASAEVELSNDADFNELYMTHMMFGEE